MGILRDRMIEEVKLRNFSPATQKSYLYAVTRLTKYYRKAPDQLDKEQIRSYLLHLTVERTSHSGTKVVSQHHDGADLGITLLLQ
jgi:integrase/recombinase XerD